MTRQQQWDKLFLMWALDVAQMSYAKKARVGAIAVRDRRVIALGYNGTPVGEDNTCEYSDEQGNLITKDNVIHAEENLILFCRENDINLGECTIYVTHAPCINCATLIYQAGVKHVIFGEYYRKPEGLAYLRAHGVPCTCLGVTFSPYDILEMQS